MKRLRLSWVVLPSWVLGGLLVAALAAQPALAAPHHGYHHRPSRAVCPEPSPFGTADCGARVVTNAEGTPAATTSPSGYGPADFHGAYALPANAPAGQTIAIVDAYDDPTIEADLAQYSSTYSLPACTKANGCFRKVNQSGKESSYPKADEGWALEIALDVETAHAICQNCKILLVEASSASLANLGTAVNTAATLGATVISNSYGAGEFSSEVSETAFRHPGIAVVASAGDGGYKAEFPAASPYVVAVGGTTLTLGPSQSYGGETVWSGTGSGCSAYTSAQSWQLAVPSWSLTGCEGKRGVADVAADADPSTGASVYTTTKYKGQSGWLTVGGTSLAAPLIASVYALAGGGGAEYPAADLYAHAADSPATLHDITSGSNGNCGTRMCNAAVGYDGPTGMGTPNGIAAFAPPSAGDTTPPVTTIESGPTGATNQATPAFAFVANEAASFECRVDAAAFAPCSSPFTTETLADGAHSFEVRATDLAHNVGAAASRGFSVDTTAPTSQASSPVAQAGTSITVSYSASDSGSGLALVELWVKKPGAGSYTEAAKKATSQTSGTFSYPATAGDGTYAFYTRARDAAGNYEAAPASADTVTRIDTTPPVTTIESGPSGAIAEAQPSFSFSANEQATFQCRVDSASFTACTTPYVPSSLSDGSHSFEVKATDSVGNVGVAAKRTFTVDTTAPVTTIESGPSGLTAEGMPSFKFSANEQATFQCRVDAAAFTACTSPFVTASLSDGSHAFEVKATDSVGNVGAAAKRTFTVDTTAPVTTIESGPSGTTTETTPSFSFSANEGATFQCRIDSTSFAACTSPYVASSLADGAHTFEVKATDLVGNVGAAASRDFTVETPVPPDEGPKVEEHTGEGPPGETPQSSPVAETVTSLLSLPAPFGSSSKPRLTLGKVVVDKSHRSARLTVLVSGPGQVVLSGARVVKVTRTAGAAGSLQLPVRLRAGTGQVTETVVKVTFSPADGAPITKRKIIRFG